MSNEVLQVLVAGFGQIAAGYAGDTVMAEYYPYASHAQVLSHHPKFQLQVVIDPSEEARRLAQDIWKVSEVVASLDEISSLETIDVLVLANPPGIAREQLITALPNLKLVIVEKPLGGNLAQARNFLELCEQRDIPVQVNFLRRADKTTRLLAAGGLHKEIGEVQSASVVYGNGIHNNGSHMIDLVRKLLGEVKAVQAFPNYPAFSEGPIQGDLNLASVLHLESGLPVSMTPLRFSSYRENGLDVWGTAGRLALLQEGSLKHRWPVVASRLTSEDSEIASDQGQVERTFLGHALYELYENVAAFLEGREPLCSPGTSALKTQVVLSAIMRSYREEGRIIVCEDE